MDNHHRRSIRLKGFDYSQSFYYFITICSYQKQYLFGKIEYGEMKLNELGKIVKREYMQTLQIRKNVILDEYVIMPNHIHGIVAIIDKNQNSVRRLINDNQYCRGVLQYAPTQRIFCSPSQTIGSIVRGFKSAATKKINILRKTPDNPVWQRNYFEHIVRNEKSLNKIRQYIANNPINWENDENNLGVKSRGNS